MIEKTGLLRIYGLAVIRHDSRSNSGPRVVGRSQSMSVLGVHWCVLRAFSYRLQLGASRSLGTSGNKDIRASSLSMSFRPVTPDVT